MYLDRKNYEKIRAIMEGREIPKEEEVIAEETETLDEAEFKISQRVMYGNDKEKRPAVIVKKKNENFYMIKFTSGAGSDNGKRLGDAKPVMAHKGNLHPIKEETEVESLDEATDEQRCDVCFGPMGECSHSQFESFIKDLTESEVIAIFKDHLLNEAYGDNAAVPVNEAPSDSYYKIDHVADDGDKMIYVIYPRYESGIKGPDGKKYDDYIRVVCYGRTSQYVETFGLPLSQFRTLGKVINGISQQKRKK